MLARHTMKVKRMKKKSTIFRYSLRIYVIQKHLKTKTILIVDTVKKKRNMKGFWNIF